jgi:hypothetical protein
MQAASRQAIRTLPPSARLRAAHAAAATLGIALLVYVQGCTAGKPSRLLLAPMISGVELCRPPPEASELRTEPDLEAYCDEANLSAARIIEAALAELGPAVSKDGRFELGYTMPVPLLKLVVPGESGWQVNRRAVERFVLTVKESSRPLILHLFSTHFGTGVPSEAYLASDPANLAVSALGPMPKDKYYFLDIYPWTLASTDNGITRFREMAIAQVVDAICALPDRERRKIRAVTLLGELHHFHADFQAGMGVGGPYIVSDYSAASIDGFRSFLRERFGEIGALNKAVGEDFASFDEVQPPRTDLRLNPQHRFSEHIDSAAHGKLPLTGWLVDSLRKPGEPAWVRIYRSGTLVARTPARYGRQDVLQAKPSIGTADVGWRFDMDFAGLPPGHYRLDFAAERPDGTLARLGQRRIAIMDRTRTAAAPRPSAPMPELTDGAGLDGSIDYPPDLSLFFYNPLVPLWHEFRNEQVVRYLARFEHQLRASCLGDVPLYTHQIAPFTNPGWDTTKFAVDGSLADPGRLRLGVSLYGESTYGASFFDWLDTTTHQSYGITEFHPLKAMSSAELSALLDRHARRGARFVSFFLDARPRSVRDPSSANMFYFDPGNTQFGSDKLYTAVRELLRN